MATRKFNPARLGPFKEGTKVQLREACATEQPRLMARVVNQTGTTVRVDPPLEGMSLYHREDLVRARPYKQRPIDPAKDDETFWRRVNCGTSLLDCWNWNTPIVSDYPTCSWRGNTEIASRVAYQITFGVTLSTEEVIDHLCRNTKCCNPMHLQVVEQRVNVARGNWPSAVNKRLTHCKRGHEFTPENTRISKHGSRQCRACARERWHDIKGDKRS